MVRKIIKDLRPDEVDSRVIKFFESYDKLQLN